MYCFLRSDTVSTPYMEIMSNLCKSIASDNRSSAVLWANLVCSLRDISLSRLLSISIHVRRRLTGMEYLSHERIIRADRVSPLTAAA